MGRRSAASTLSGILLAFMDKQTWAQAHLADRVGVNVRAVRAALEELEANGMPLSMQHRHPHVEWSVPDDWAPEGVIIPREEALDLLRLLARAQDDAHRQRLLERLLEALPDYRAYGALANRTHTGRTRTVGTDAWRTDHLEVVEDAIARATPLRMEYYSAHRGTLEDRVVSVAAVVHGQELRFIARCHRDERVKWFRLDAVRSAAPVPGEPLRGTTEAEVRALREQSVDGFHGGGVAREYVVWVRFPEARWAARNTPCAVHVEPVDDGVRLVARTAGAPRLAAWVVGLGAAARAETPELRELVRELAQGALRANPIHEASARTEPDARSGAPPPSEEVPP